MDCNMPIMDGWQATETIRLREKELNHKRTPIIAVTANAMKGDAEKVRNVLGCGRPKELHSFMSIKDELIEGLIKRMRIIAVTTIAIWDGVEI